MEEEVDEEGRCKGRVFAHEGIVGVRAREAVATG